MKKFLLIVSLIFAQKGFAQLTKTSSSSLPANTLYVVDGQVTDSSIVSKIGYNAIESVNVVKRDTVVNTKKYSAQIHVQLKKGVTAPQTKGQK